MTELHLPQVVQLILYENLLTFHLIGRLAKTSKSLRQTLSIVKNKFTWIAKTHSIDLLRWRLNISDTHSILESALDMSLGVKKGASLLSWCCSLQYYNKTDTHTPNSGRKSFDLEYILNTVFSSPKHKSDSQFEYNQKYYENTQTELFQHHVNSNDGWFVGTPCKKTKWSGFSGLNYWLTFSDSIETCSCRHCTVYKTFPSSKCTCPTCSDPILGPIYWKKLTNID